MERNWNLSSFVWKTLNKRELELKGKYMIPSFHSGGALIHDFRGATNDYILSELERRKGDLRTQLVWIGVQKEPGFTSRTWKWVNGNWFFHFQIEISIKEYIYAPLDRRLFISDDSNTMPSH